jgi:anti-sigma factor RsiW
MAIVNCRDVWPEISNCLDGELPSGPHAEPGLRAEIDQHVSGCARCASVLRGTENVIQLYRDPRMMPVPASLRAGLRQRIQARAIPERGTLRGLFVGLTVAGAFAILLLMAGGQKNNEGALRAAMAQPAYRVSSDPVFVTAAGKLFHRAGCPFMHGPEKLLSAADALTEGYAPCIRCMKDALRSVEITPQGPPLETALIQ